MKALLVHPMSFVAYVVFASDVTLLVPSNPFTGAIIAAVILATFFHQWKLTIMPIKDTLADTDLADVANHYQRRSDGDGWASEFWVAEVELPSGTYELGGCVSLGEYIACVSGRRVTHRVQSTWTQSQQDNYEGCLCRPSTDRRV